MVPSEPSLKVARGSVLAKSRRIELDGRVEFRPGSTLVKETQKVGSFIVHRRSHHSSFKLVISFACAFKISGAHPSSSMQRTSAPYRLPMQSLAFTIENDANHDNRALLALTYFFEIPTGRVPCCFLDVVHEACAHSLNNSHSRGAGYGRPGQMAWSRFG